MDSKRVNRFPWCPIMYYSVIIVIPYSTSISRCFPSHTTRLMVLIMVLGQAEVGKFNSIIIMNLEDSRGGIIYLDNGLIKYSLREIC